MRAERPPRSNDRGGIDASLKLQFGNGRKTVCSTCQRSGGVIALDVIVTETCLLTFCKYGTEVDLGKDLTGTDAIGEIRFIDGPMPGNDYLGVECPSPLDISLLQMRLNELNAGIRISLA
jgi:hypothetical protein